MQVTKKSLPKSTLELTITATSDELKPFRAKAIARLSQEVKIAGFRPGHVPEDKIVERVGEEVVQRETAELAVDELFRQAIDQEKITPIARAEVDLRQIDPLEFVARVPLLPEVTLGEYQKIKLKKESVEVKKEDVEEEVKRIKKAFRTTNSVERAAKKGDRVEIDFEGFTPDGVPLAGTKSKNHPLEIGSGNFIPGFEDELVGLTPGAEKEFQVKFPADYHAKHLADKPVKFRIKTHKVEELIDPELDDTLATKLKGEPSKWNDIEEEIKKILTEERKNTAEQKLESDLIEKLLETAKLEVPDALIQEEVDFMLQDFQAKLRSGGLSWPSYLEKSKKTEKQVREELASEAEKRVKVRLIVTKLVEVEKPEVTDAELQAEVSRLQAENPTQANEISQKFGPLTPEGLRLKHQLKILKMLKNLSNSLAK